MRKGFIFKPLEAIYVELWVGYAVVMNVHYMLVKVSFQYLIPNTKVMTKLEIKYSYKLIEGSWCHIYNFNFSWTLLLVVNTW